MSSAHPLSAPGCEEQDCVGNGGGRPVHPASHVDCCEPCAVQPCGAARAAPESRTPARVAGVRNLLHLSCRGTLYDVHVSSDQSTYRFVGGGRRGFA